MGNKLIVIFEDNVFGPPDIPEALVFNNELDMSEYFNEKGMRFSGLPLSLSMGVNRRILTWGGSSFDVQIYWAKSFRC